MRDRQGSHFVFLSMFSVNISGQGSDSKRFPIFHPHTCDAIEKWQHFITSHYVHIHGITGRRAVIIAKQARESIIFYYCISLTKVCTCNSF